VADVFITGVTKERGRIVTVLIDHDAEYGIDEVINHISLKDEGWEHVYTFAEGYRKARVFVKTLWTGTRFLCTPPDGIMENNLSNLS